MKKKLLYLTSIVLFSVASVNAQTTVWNFSDNTVSVDGTVTVASPAFPAAGLATSGSATVAGTAPNTIKVGGLNLYSATAAGSTTNFAAISSNKQTFSDGYAGENRASTGGSSAAADTYLPTVRYYSFNVSGPCTVKVWIKHTTGVPTDQITNPPTTRTLFVSNGSAPYGSGSVTNNASANVHNIVTANVTSAGLVYVYGDNSIAIYKIEVSGATLSTNSFQAAESSVVVYGNDGKINIANVTSATKINVYNVLGSLVKSTETSGDVSLPISTSGVYIVKAQSEEGAKTVKVLVK